MKAENKKSLESLSFTCHMTGLFSVFIGLAVGFMDLLKGDMRHVQVGIFVFAVGYALVKIGARMSDILISEGTLPPGQ